MGKHAIDRARQRYNIDLTYDDEAKIIELIKNGNMILLGTSDRDYSILFAYVIYKHIPLKILYKGKKIITIYPFDVDEYNEIIDLGGNK